MIYWLSVLLRLAAAGLKSRRNLLLENLALRHKLLILSRGSHRPQLRPMDRALWAWLSRAWIGWKTRLCLVQPSTRACRKSVTISFLTFRGWNPSP